MEGLGILEQISQWLGSAAGSANSAISGMPGGYFGAGAMALGGASDVASTIGRYQVGQAIMQNQQILGNPKKLMAFIQGVYQPMTQAEQEAIGRDLNAVLATQGTTSGGYAKQFIANALAKIESQRFQDASLTGIRSLQGTPNIGSVMPQGGGALAGILQQLATLRARRNPSMMDSGLGWDLKTPDAFSSGGGSTVDILRSVLGGGRGFGSSLDTSMPELMPEITPPMTPALSGA